MTLSTLSSMLQSFFFLRPLWLLMLIPVCGLVIWLFHGATSGRTGHWHKLMDAHLLRHLVQPAGVERRSRVPIALLGLALTCSVLALAGPAWQKIEWPTFKSREPLVVVLSLAQSMNASDLAPDRLTRAGHKVRDIFARAKGGDVGLIVYSDQPFVVAPLTSDTRVIGEMLPELSTRLMPVLGNRLDLAIDRAVELLSESGNADGRILVLSDGTGSHVDLDIQAAKAAVAAGFDLSTLGVGSKEGAELRTADGQLITTPEGQPQTSQLDVAGLTRIAQAGMGRFTTLTANSDDIDRLTAGMIGHGSSLAPQGAEFHADAWNDMGYWLLVIPVLLAPLAFRRNLLLVLPLCLSVGLLTSVPEAQASTWSDLWQTPDQQAARQFEQENFAGAAETFNNPAWKASALYRAEEYSQAAESNYSHQDFDQLYNQGNALANAGEFKAALSAYDNALALQPDEPDAVFNRELIAKLLEQQQTEEQQSQSGPPSQDEKQAQDDQPSQSDQQPQDGQQGQGEQQSQDGQQGQGEQQPQDGQQGQGEQQPQDGQQGQGEQQSQDGQQGQGEQQSQDGQQGQGEQQSQDGQQTEELEQGQGGKQSQDTRQSQDESQSLAGEDSDTTPMDGQTREMADGRGAFRKAMDEWLQGNGGADDVSNGPADPTQEDAQRPTASGYSEQQQALEQQLRAVPDDPSGLLRARIRQHYRQQQAGRN